MDNIIYISMDMGNNQDSLVKCCLDMLAWIHKTDLSRQFGQCYLYMLSQNRFVIKAIVEVHGRVLEQGLHEDKTVIEPWWKNWLLTRN